MLSFSETLEEIAKKNAAGVKCSAKNRLLKLLCSEGHKNCLINELLYGNVVPKLYNNIKL